MDLRILLKDQPYHRKFPGGYFRLPGDYSEDVKYTGEENFITYAGWNSRFSHNLPLPMQRGMMDNYCRQKGININDYQFENEYLDWLPNLRSFIKEKPHGIILTSIFSLPDNKEWRDEILEMALEHKVELHFANELTVLKTRQDLERTQTYCEWSTAPGSSYMG
jgi:sporadic carbohydrate cluster protein (TIGR04323 family)